MDRIRTSLESSRLELLDMGLRSNTLLHFSTGAKTLVIFDELSAQIYNLLVEKKQPMSFLPVPDQEKKENENGEDETPPLPQLLEEIYGDSRHTDNRLQTQLSADALDKKLLKLNTESRNYYQEQGVEILYLALGFLTWFEDQNSKKPRKAPLILVPVSIERGSAKERYKIRYTETDIGTNLNLSAKMRMEFSLELPEINEDLELQTYFDAVDAAIANQPRWKVERNDIALGFFSFGKFQMYQDLDSDNWPEGSQPQDHSVLKGLLGEGFSHHHDDNLSFGNNEQLAEQNLSDLTSFHFVKDSDSSQSEAVLAVTRGQNLVIQGPPGTGKSQTITNIIAEIIANNKTVLFVAEKMAALEVVKRRLDECHLGDGVLELHSHKSNKRAVLEEIKRTLELGKPQSPDRHADKERHRKLSQSLDNYSEAVNKPIHNTNTSYVYALGQYLNLQHLIKELSISDIEIPSMQHWSEDQFNKACTIITELVEHLKTMGIPANSPFAASELEQFSPTNQELLNSHIKKAQATVLDCQANAQLLAEAMCLEVGKEKKELQTLCRGAEQIINAPNFSGVQLTANEWQLQQDQINTLLTAGAQMQKIKAARKGQLIDQAWQADVLHLRQIWTSIGAKWWRFLSGDFRKAQQKLQGLLIGELPKKHSECLAIIDDILSMQSANENFNQHQQIGKNIFGGQWQGTQSDWTAMVTVSEWVMNLYTDIEQDNLPKDFLLFLENTKTLPALEKPLDAYNTSRTLLNEHIHAIKKCLSINTATEDTTWQDLSLPQLSAIFNTLIEKIALIYHMTRYNCMKKQLNDNELAVIAELSYNWQHPPQALLTTFKMAWFKGLIDKAYEDNKIILKFDRTSHEKAIEEFKKLDRELFSHAQEDLVIRLHERLPKGESVGEMSVLRKEMNKKQRHLPLRRLIEKAGRAIQQAKPVFMMSPMSVSTYLKQGAIEFDVVIFDEASQVKVVDALGPILRGKQVVVVGDTRQMPPTDFFGKALQLDDKEAEESETADIESILSMFLAKGASEKMLRWHYRSRHDSLIAVSNQEFYDNKLMIFPSPGLNVTAKGLSFNYLPSSVYERGTSRTNPIEARQIAESVMAYARNTPELTLGVVAFSTAQRDCIVLELERLRRQDDSCEHFFTNNTLEGFFVKNLENVQGDERDTIFISIGYGKTSTGKVSQSFGPLNKEGGHRRLNVLITRARLAMEVFCNFTADELMTKSDSPFGIKALKNFLHFAQHGKIKDRKETGKETDSPFEDEVISAIQGLGYDVEPQVGSAGFFIDIAVIDPSKPGRYILAVECDGASYHSSASARDRDRLRQSVLEGLGWRFHRIWSTDWFRSAHTETERLRESIKDAIQYHQQTDEMGAPEIPKAQNNSVQAEIERTEPVAIASQSVKPYLLSTGSLGIPLNIEVHEIDLNSLSKAITEIVTTEGAVHIKEVAKRIANSAGFNRVGTRIMTQIEQAANLGHRSNDYYFADNFIYKDATRKVELRDRTNLPSTHRKIELVPQEEIDEAVQTIVKMAYTITRDDAATEVLSLLGFQRCTAKSKQVISESILRLVKENKLERNSGLLSIIK